MLTERQQQVLDFIKAYVDHHGGLAPSYREINEAVDLGSLNAVHRIIGGLQERGFIRRISGRARAIAVLSQEPADRERRLREATTALVERFGREAACGYVSQVPAAMIQAIREALR